MASAEIEKPADIYSARVLLARQMAEHSLAQVAVFESLEGLQRSEINLRQAQTFLREYDESDFDVTTELLVPVSAVKLLSALGIEVANQDSKTD